MEKKNIHLTSNINPPSNQCKRNPKARAAMDANTAAGAATEAPEAGAGAGASAAAASPANDDTATIAIAATAENLSFNPASISQQAKNIDNKPVCENAAKIDCNGVRREMKKRELAIHVYIAGDASGRLPDLPVGLWAPSC